MFINVFLPSYLLASVFVLVLCEQPHGSIYSECTYKDGEVIAVKLEGNLVAEEAIRRLQMFKTHTLEKNLFTEVEFHNMCPLRTGCSNNNNHWKLHRALSRLMSLALFRSLYSKLNVCISGRTV